jgi:hypothetical protein
MQSLFRDINEFDVKPYELQVCVDVTVYSSTELKKAYNLKRKKDNWPAEIRFLRAVAGYRTTDHKHNENIT